MKEDIENREEGGVDNSEVGEVMDTDTTITNTTTDPNKTTREERTRFHPVAKREIPLCSGLNPNGLLCSRYVGQGSKFCTKHRDSLPLVEKTPEGLSVTLTNEIKSLKLFLNRLTKTTKDPKVLNRINDLIVSVSNLNEKILGLGTREQFKQIGFYFSSILFKFIENGTKYEMARLELLDSLRKMGVYSEEEITKEMVKD